MNEKDLLEQLKKILIENEHNDVEITFKKFKGDYEKPVVRIIKKQSNKGYLNKGGKRK